MKPQLSVIIPVYNEAKYIPGCLESLNHQTLKPDEIIIVDDGSTDETLKIVNSLNSKNPAGQIENCKLKIVSQAHHGAGAARNLGAQHATGEILVFVDADMEFSPEFIDRLSAPIRQGKAKGTFSKHEYVKNWHNPWAKAWNFCLSLKDNRLIPQNYPDTAPVFRAILKSEFDRAAGFDQTRGYDDDWTLSEKLGYQATVASDAIYYHHNPDSPREIFRQARWQASRKYKLGVLGQILALIKISFRIFLVRNLYQFIALNCYLAGLKIGFMQNLLRFKVSK